MGAGEITGPFGNLLYCLTATSFISAMPFSIHRLYDSIFRIWRTKRFELFIEKLKPSLQDRLVDVGGYPKFWISHPPVVHSLDLINLESYSSSWNNASYPDHRIQTFFGDGRNLDIADRTYDIVFSNSVIEHVGGWEDQVSFAKEARRIGKSLWVQTPAYACPIEPHYLAPFVHWLPKALRKKIVRYFTPWGWISKPSKQEADNFVDEIRLLTFKEMKKLFPDCEIHTEYLLGIFPKSYIAIRQKSSL